MLTIFLFSIPLSSYITLSVVVMVLWAFFVMTKLQIDTSSGNPKRAARPEPTPFSFFKPGDNPTPIIPPSTLSDQELAISVNVDKGRVARNKPASDKPTPTPDPTAPVPDDKPAVAVPANPMQHGPMSAKPPTAPATPPTPSVNADFTDTDDQPDYALYQSRQVSIVPPPPIVVISIDTPLGETAEPTHEQLKTLRDLENEADEKVLNRKRKTEQLMKLAAGLDFEAYVILFRTYFDKAMTIQKEEPERAFYVIFGELIAGETAGVQEQLLMLLDKEATDEEPDRLVQAEVYTEEDEAEPAFT